MNTPIKAALYKTARLTERMDVSIPAGYLHGQFVAVRYAGIGAEDEPTYVITAVGCEPALVAADTLERLCL